VTTGRQDKSIVDFLSGFLMYSVTAYREIIVECGDTQPLLDYIGGEFNPEDVFSENSLRDWAFRNGFVEGE